MSDYSKTTKIALAHWALEKTHFQHFPRLHLTFGTLYNQYQHNHMLFIALFQLYKFFRLRENRSRMPRATFQHWHLMTRPKLFPSTLFLHSFHAHITKFTSQTNTNLISTYSWSRHTIPICRNVLRHAPKNNFLTWFSEEALLRVTKMAAEWDRLPPSSVWVTSSWRGYSFVYWRCSGVPRVRLYPTSLLCMFLFLVIL